MSPFATNEVCQRIDIIPGIFDVSWVDTKHNILKSLPLSLVQFLHEDFNGSPISMGKYFCRMVDNV